jgi:hypothetical protein
VRTQEQRSGMPITCSCALLSTVDSSTFRIGDGYLRKPLFQQASNNSNPLSTAACAHHLMRHNTTQKLEPGCGGPGPRRRRPSAVCRSRTDCGLGTWTACTISHPTRTSSLNHRRFARNDKVYGKRPARTRSTPPTKRKEEYRNKEGKKKKKEKYRCMHQLHPSK